MAGARSFWVRLEHESAEATASGIYGIIVGAAVLVAGHADTAWKVVAAVLVTLIVYWAAERYARIVAERIHEGHRPAWHVVREHLTSGWELVTASILPLLVLILIRLVGARLITAEILSLTCSTLLLCVAGWRIGATGRLTTGERLVSTVAAGALGAIMIVLKVLLH
jgi:positive regulator of sigma E activity